jgi:glutathione S-transferase
MSNSNATVEALVIRRTYKASRERVFAAWTQPEILERWMTPEGGRGTKATIDARTGGKYRIVMTADDGELFVAGGVVREFSPPERIQYMWQWEDDDGKPEGNETILTIDLRDHDGGTELVLTHENFVDGAQRGRHESGWNGMLDALSAAI